MVVILIDILRFGSRAKLLNCKIEFKACLKFSLTTIFASFPPEIFSDELDDYMT